jgi:hypothetical protein
MSDEWAVYKFKWSNYNIEIYAENQKAKASNLRRQAELLILKAETIEEEVSELTRILIPAEEEP